MSENTMQTAKTNEMLPTQDQTLAFEMIRKMVLAWDPDFTKLTPGERKALEDAEKELEAFTRDAINRN